MPELFQREADGATWLQLARWLDDVAPKPNGRHWIRRVAEVIIKNRMYLGEARRGEYVSLAAHEALTTPGLWRAGQNPGTCDATRHLPAHLARAVRHLRASPEGQNHGYGPEPDVRVLEPRLFVQGRHHGGQSGYGNHPPTCGPHLDLRGADTGRLRHR